MLSKGIIRTSQEKWLGDMYHEYNHKETSGKFKLRGCQYNYCLVFNISELQKSKSQRKFEDLPQIKEHCKGNLFSVWIRINSTVKTHTEYINFCHG